MSNKIDLTIGVCTIPCASTIKGIILFFLLFLPTLLLCSCSCSSLFFCSVAHVLIKLVDKLPKVLPEALCAVNKIQDEWLHPFRDIKYRYRVDDWKVLVFYLLHIPTSQRFILLQDMLKVFITRDCERRHYQPWCFTNIGSKVGI